MTEAASSGVRAPPGGVTVRTACSSMAPRWLDGRAIASAEPPEHRGTVGPASTAGFPAGRAVGYRDPMPTPLTVLLVGESWFTYSVHQKGFDTFETAEYTEGAGEFIGALRALGDEV